MHDLPETRSGFVGSATQRFSRRFAASRIYPSEFRYNLTIGRRPKFVWFRVAKAGTRSVFQFLRDADAAFEMENGIFRHYAPRAFDTYFRFAFVRHPVDRFISCWRDRVVDRNHFGFTDAEHRRMQDLTEFVAFASVLDVSRCDVHLRLQSRLIDLGNVDFIGRMENFVTDLETVAGTLGLAVPEIPRKNVSSRSPSMEVDCDLRGKIAAIYQRDMRIFGYSAE